MVVVLTTLIALQAVLFVVDAITLTNWGSSGNLVSTGLRDLGVPAAIASLIAAVLLARRAYGLFRYERGAWRVTLVLFILKAVASLFILLATGQVFGGPLVFLLPLVGIAFLLSPSVRRLYQQQAMRH
jgi:hypothetical protein